MRIAYLSASKIPSKEANSVHVMKMVEAFKQNHVEVDLYARKQKNATNIYDTYGVEQFPIFFQNWPKIPFIGGLYYGFFTFLKARRQKYDCYFGRDKYSLLFVRLFSKKPYIYESHAIPQRKFTRLIESILTKSKRLKKLICISSNLSNDYLNIFPHLKDRILVLHDAANIQSLLKSTKNYQQVGYVGHLYNGRGIDIIIEIAKHLPEFSFHIVGGEEKDVKRWKDISPSNIIYYGYVPNAALSLYYQKFNICLAPYQKKVTIQGKGDTSRWMSPLKIFEYMSFKKAILCSNIDVLTEVLQHQKNAILLTSNNISEWVNALRELQQMPEIIDRLANNAYQDFLDNYTWTARAQVILKNY